MKTRTAINQKAESRPSPRFNHIDRRKVHICACGKIFSKQKISEIVDRLFLLSVLYHYRFDCVRIILIQLDLIAKTGFFLQFLFSHTIHHVHAIVASDL